jgi:hypothetical protein
MFKMSIFFASDFSGTCCPKEINDVPEGSGNNLKKKILEKAGG